MTIDYGSDYQWVDGVESLTLTPQNPVAAAIANVKGVRLSLSYREIVAASFWGIEPGDLVFIVWVGSLSGATPKGGDLITDGDAITWVVRMAQLAADGSQYRLLCTKAA